MQLQQYIIQNFCSILLGIDGQVQNGRSLQPLYILMTLLYLHVCRYVCLYVSTPSKASTTRAICHYQSNYQMITNRSKGYIVI